MKNGYEEPAEVTRKREAEMDAKAAECARLGHLFYVKRAHCARCFAPKPDGWQQ